LGKDETIWIGDVSDMAEPGGAFRPAPLEDVDSSAGDPALESSEGFSVARALKMNHRVKASAAFDLAAQNDPVGCDLDRGVPDIGIIIETSQAGDQLIANIGHDLQGHFRQGAIPAGFDPGGGLAAGNAGGSVGNGRIT